MLTVCKKRLSSHELRDIFGNDIPSKILEINTPKEAIQKIKDYEEKKEENERIGYLKYKDFEKDRENVRVWYGETDSRRPIRKENGKYLKRAVEENKEKYRELAEKAISGMFEMLNRSEEGEENNVKTGDKFIIEISGVMRNEDTRFKKPIYLIKDMNIAVTEETIKLLKKYEQKEDEEIKVEKDIKVWDECAR